MDNKIQAQTIFITVVITLLIVFGIYYWFPPKVRQVDNNNTRIICNIGNKKVFFASEAGIIFTVEDFKQTQLPDNKITQIQKICNITNEEINKSLDTLSNVFFKYPDHFKVFSPLGLYKIEPAFKYIY
jgi:hypothetical protein